MVSRVAGIKTYSKWNLGEKNRELPKKNLKEKKKA
jgi:hypothetical protein